MNKAMQGLYFAKKVETKIFVMVMSIMARQNVRKWPNFGCHKLSKQYLVSISTTDYSNKGDLPSIWIKISKKDDTDFKITQVRKLFSVCCYCYDIKHTMENCCHAFYQFTIRFMKLSSPLGTKLKGF